MVKTSSKPIALGVLLGALVGALVGLMVASRRAKGGRARLDAKSIATVGLTTVTLVKQLIDIFSQ